MADTLASLTQSKHPDLLVGFNKADDAGVFRISSDLALVQTVDFFPPIVDDAYQFGQIAAANAVSDIYAMGGKPLTALNIVCFPINKLPAEILTRVLEGAGSKLDEAGAVVLGGHSIKDTELKFGVAVTGIISPKKVITNSGAQIGDKLFLTKPLGTGIITTGIKRNAVSHDIVERVIASMIKLNKTGCELMIKHGAHAATDITGYGLLGHAYEMASGSNVSINLFSNKIPLIDGAKELAAQGILTGGADGNREFLEGKVSIPKEFDKNLEHVLFDPQTSGGLLIAMPAKKVDEFSQALKKNHLYSEVIGEVVTQLNYAISIR